MRQAASPPKAGCWFGHRAFVALIALSLVGSPAFDDELEAEATAESATGESLHILLDAEEQAVAQATTFRLTVKVVANLASLPSPDGVEVRLVPDDGSAVIVASLVKPTGSANHEASLELTDASSGCPPEGLCSLGFQVEIDPPVAFQASAWAFMSENLGCCETGLGPDGSLRVAFAP